MQVSQGANEYEQAANAPFHKTKKLCPEAYTLPDTVHSLNPVYGTQIKLYS